VRFGLKLREEIHCAHMLAKPGPLARIAKHDRLAIIRYFADQIGAMTEFSIINVVIDKARKPADYDVFGMAWKVLLQRFENTISHHNFPGPRNADDRGLLICDNTDNRRLQMLLRSMRRFNFVPHHPAFAATGSRNIPILGLVEDPNFRDSAHSFFIQAVDVATYLLQQRFAPNVYMRKKAGQNYWQRLLPCYCLHASRSRTDGVVLL
jgi:Protein of unknown function (DUF3800)